MTFLATAALWSEIATAQADTSEIRRQIERPNPKPIAQRHDEDAANVFYYRVLKTTQSRKQFEPIPGEWRAFIRKLPRSLMQTLSEQLTALVEDANVDGAEAPAIITIETAKAILERSFALGLVPERILSSGEGGVFIAYARGTRMANIEIFNEGPAFAATHSGGISVWPIATEDRREIDAAIGRILGNSPTENPENPVPFSEPSELLYLRVQPSGTLNGKVLASEFRFRQPKSGEVPSGMSFNRGSMSRPEDVLVDKPATWSVGAVRVGDVPFQLGCKTTPSEWSISLLQTTTLTLKSAVTIDGCCL